MPADPTPRPARRACCYVSNVMPGSGGGGAIIVQRHLEHLVRGGWDVTVLEPPRATTAPWRSVPLPARRWWWPPFRPRLRGLATITSCVWRRALRTGGLPVPDVFVTVAWGPLSWLAAELARTWRRPLVAIAHDHWSERPGDAEAIHAFHRTCRQACVILAVSPEMQARLQNEFGARVELLYPVSAPRRAPFASWRPEYAQRPRVVHAGALLPFHGGYLERLAAALAGHHGELLLLCPAGNPVLAALRSRCPNLVHRDYFAENDDALRWIAREASAVTVMHARGLDHRDRPPTGFPSRLVEFAQLGLPMLLAAPPVNPLAQWARKQTWRTVIAPDDEPALLRSVAQLTHESDWSAFAAQTRSVAETDFSPAHLHALFESALLDSIRTSAGGLFAAQTSR